jgi:hypothetical protein
MVVVGSFFDEVGRQMVVIQATSGSVDVASGENRASTSVMADNDGVFGCHFLREGIVYVALVVRLGLLRGNPRSGAPGLNDGGTPTSLPLTRASFWSTC